MSFVRDTRRTEDTDSNQRSDIPYEPSDLGIGILPKAMKLPSISIPVLSCVISHAFVHSTKPTVSSVQQKDSVLLFGHVL
jgi:hypothetical protein